MNDEITFARHDYECGCGAKVKTGTELHRCNVCGALQCPNCFDYDTINMLGYLCEEHISGQKE